MSLRALSLKIYLEVSAGDWLNPLMPTKKKATKKHPPKKLKDVEARVRKAAAEGRIEMAPQENVYEYPEIFDRFVDKVLCFRAVMMTDMTYMSDFCDSGRDTKAREKEFKKWADKIKKEFGVDASLYLNKPVWEIFEFIANNEPDRSLN